MLVSLPLLLRVRVLDRALLQPLAALDVLLLETLGAGAGLAGLPEARLVAVLDAEPGAEAAEEAMLGPSARLGSDRALLLELAARAGGEPEALRWLQLTSPLEAGEVLASRPVAAELATAGARTVGGPAPPVFTAAGELLTRI